MSGIIPGLCGGNHFIHVSFLGHSLWVRKTHKQNPLEIPGPAKIMFYVFFFVVFCARKDREDPSTLIKEIKALLLN